MALLRPRPYPVGITIPVRVDRGAKVTIAPPSGKPRKVNVDSGSFKLELSEPGTWRWSWGKESREVQVIARS